MAALCLAIGRRFLDAASVRGVLWLEMGRRAAFVALGSAWLLQTTAALAQSSDAGVARDAQTVTTSAVSDASAPISDAPREAFARGMQALQGGRYADAVNELEASYAGRAVPVVQYNLALAYRGLGRSRAAITAFERYLTDAAQTAADSELVAVRAEVARLRSSLGTLLLTVEPADSIVRVDGQRVEVRPEGVSVDPGAHVVDVTRDGRRPEHRELRVDPGASLSVRVSLAPAVERARLVVFPSVPDATVFVDSIVQGAGYVETSVLAGEHNVEVRARGYRTVSRTIRSDGRAPIQIPVTLIALPPERRSVPLAPVLGIIGGVLGVTALSIGIPFAVRGTASPPATSWGIVREP